MTQSSPDSEAIELIDSAYSELCVKFSGVHSDDEMDSVLLRLCAALKKLRAPSPQTSENDRLHTFEDAGFNTCRHCGEERVHKDHRAPAQAATEQPNLLEMAEKALAPRLAEPQAANETSRETERTAFINAYHPNLDLTEVPDAWGRLVFKHSHVQALWDGWFARAILDEAAK